MEKLTAWRRASDCADSACVEARRVGYAVQVRDSKTKGGPVLWFTLEEWDAFTRGVAAGEFRFAEEPAVA